MQCFSAHREPARVLVAEDEQIVALELKDRLSRAGHEVAAIAASAEEAIEAAERLHPDLLIMDIKLQGDMDGIAAVEVIRRLADVPVIYLTAFADSRTVERAKATGPYGYILKPFDERELQIAVEMALCKHEVILRQRFLAAAGREISSSLDRDVLLSKLTSLVVRDLADWCTVHLLDEDGGSLRIHSLAHARADLSSLASHLPSAIVSVGEGGCLSRALAGVSSLESAIGDPSWTTGVLGLPAAQVAASGIGACAFVCVPLCTRGRSLGALTLVAEHPRRRFTELDLLSMEELGRLAGAGIENARLYAVAQRAVRLREDVLAIVSHDLRSPLSAISLRAGRLLRSADHLSLDEVLEQARQIGWNVDRMSRLVDDLLDFALIDSGRLSVESAPCCARELLLDAAALFDAPAAERSVRIVDEGSPEGAVALCDRDRILQVFSNLLGNALKIGPEGAVIRIGAAADGRMVQFHISDEAGGIAPDQVDHVFERYWRAPRQAHGGAGLGLPIARGIVEAHGGRIWVETTPGVGSTFRFTVPRAYSGGLEADGESSARRAVQLDRASELPDEALHKLEPE
jgi:signal transduction histidine kinase/DNA-binding NarL/FixJ family response regulator